MTKGRTGLGRSPAPACASRRSPSSGRRRRRLGRGGRPGRWPFVDRHGIEAVPDPQRHQGGCPRAAAAGSAPGLGGDRAGRPPCASRARRCGQSLDHGRRDAAPTDALGTGISGVSREPPPPPFRGRGQTAGSTTVRLLERPSLRPGRTLSRSTTLEPGRRTALGLSGSEFQRYCLAAATQHQAQSEQARAEQRE